VELVPRLFPFLSHSSSVVRRASLQALIILTGPRTGPLWLPACIMDLLRHVYQRALLEHHEACLELIPRLWDAACELTPLSPLLMASCPWFGPWITLIAAPAQLPLDPAVLLPTNSTSDEEKLNEDPGTKQQFLGGQEVVSMTDQLERNRCVTRARNLGARLLGKLASFIMKPMPGIEYTAEMESPLEMLLSKVLVPQLTTNSGYQKLAIAILIIQWLELPGSPDCLAETALPGSLLTCLTTSWQFAEVAALRARLMSAGQDYLATLRHYQPGSLEPELLHRQLAGPDEVERLVGWGGLVAVNTLPVTNYRYILCLTNLILILKALNSGSYL
jgi:TATA-binding protein-associated factor